jgi:hypothetical protein
MCAPPTCSELIFVMFTQQACAKRGKLYAFPYTISLAVEFLTKTPLQRLLQCPDTLNVYTFIYRVSNLMSLYLVILFKQLCMFRAFLAHLQLLHCMVMHHTSHRISNHKTKQPHNCHKLRLTVQCKNSWRWARNARNMQSCLNKITKQSDIKLGTYIRMLY